MKAKRLAGFALLSSLLLLSGCSTVSGWFESETYEEPPTPLIEFAAEFEPQVVWRTDVGDGAQEDYAKLTPWVTDETVTAVDREGEITRLNAKTGQQIWKTDLDVIVSAGPGAGDGMVFQGTREGEIIALDAQTGKVNWKQNLSSEVLAAPSAANGVVVVRTSDGRINALSVTDGSPLWNYQRNVPLLSLRGASAPIINGDRVIAGYDNGKLVALSLADGKVIWEESAAVARGRTELDRLVDIDADPVVKGDVVYVVTFHGNVAAYSVSTGRKLWTREMSSHSGLDAMPGTAVFISDEDSYLWAVQDGSGDSLWRQTKLLRRSISGPAVVGDYVVVGDFEGYLHWLLAKDGHFVARQKLDDTPIRSKPIVRNGLLYVITTGGELTAIKVP